MLMAPAAVHAQYITEAPAGGFDISKGKNYVVFYAPADIVTQMGSKIKSNQLLDKNGVNSTCDYWGDNPSLSVCNADAGLKNSWGGNDCFDITPTGYWGFAGTACFRAITDKFDLSMLDDDYILHIGFCNNSTVTGTGYNFIFADGQVKLYAGPKTRPASGFTKVGTAPNDSKWYYIEMTVAELKQKFTAFKLQKTTDGNFFQFAFEAGTASTVTTMLEPGAIVYTYTVTALKSALGMDAFFFYKKDTGSAVESITVENPGEEAVYDLHGRRTTMDHPGIYIVKTATGTKKVVVK